MLYLLLFFQNGLKQTINLNNKTNFLPMGQRKKIYGTSKCKCHGPQSNVECVTNDCDNSRTVKRSKSFAAIVDCSNNKRSKSAKLNDPSKIIDEVKCR